MRTGVRGAVRRGGPGRTGLKDVLARIRNLYPVEASPSRYFCGEGEPQDASFRSPGQGLLSLAQLLIQHEQSRAVLSGHLEPLDDLGGGLFFLDLLLDEPVEQDL